MITLGPKGVYYSLRRNGLSCNGTLPVPDVKVVDTTGAGDSFTGGMLYSLTRHENTLDVDEKTLVQDLNFANSVASLCVTKRGAIPALPSLEQVKEFLRDNVAP